VLDDVDAEQAMVVGHDWGALVAWDMARMFPQRISALVAVSVPYTPWPAPPTDVLKHIYGDDFFYILYFQQVGPPEASWSQTCAAACTTSCGVPRWKRMCRICGGR
jgi:pimeloyl-ACP methyl ester carboxylesterase